MMIDNPPADPRGVPYVKALRKAGYQAGYHPVHGPVMFYNRQFWKVDGPDPTMPEKLTALPDVSAEEVQWVR